MMQFHIKVFTRVWEEMCAQLKHMAVIPWVPLILRVQISRVIKFLYMQLYKLYCAYGM